MSVKWGTVAFWSRFWSIVELWMVLLLKWPNWVLWGSEMSKLRHLSFGNVETGCFKVKNAKTGALRFRNAKTEYFEGRKWPNRAFWDSELPKLGVLRFKSGQTENLRFENVKTRCFKVRKCKIGALRFRNGRNCQVWVLWGSEMQKLGPLMFRKPKISALRFRNTKN